MGIPRTGCVKWCVWRDQFSSRKYIDTNFTSERTLPWEGNCIGGGGGLTKKFFFEPHYFLRLQQQFPEKWGHMPSSPPVPTALKKYTTFAFITDWLTSNFGITNKRPCEPSEVNVSVILNQPLCSSWVKVRFSSLPEKCIELNSKESTAKTQTPSNTYVSSLPENVTGQNNFSIRFYSI